MPRGVFSFVPVGWRVSSLVAFITFDLSRECWICKSSESFPAVTRLTVYRQPQVKKLDMYSHDFDAVSDGIVDFYVRPRDHMKHGHTFQKC